MGAAAAVVAIVLASACAPAAPAADAGGDVSTSCIVHGDCENGLFCDGEERCAPGSPDADGRGCISGDAPCTEGCDEASDHCTTGCTTDADGDGTRAMACGGTDCDDADPSRFPGNTEVCDAAHVDEDCDVRTPGSRDADGDGYTDATCCNLDLGGTRACGPDCNDTNGNVHPTEGESCNGVDDDCDGATDEGVLERYVVDADGDGFGDRSAGAVATDACERPPGFASVATDCDDSAATINPGAMEACNTLDDTCEGTVDEGCGCTTGETRTCGPETVGECRGGVQSCIAGRWETACAGAITPVAESCNGADDDCDGATDEGIGTTYFEDEDGDSWGTATSVVSCARPVGSWASRPGDCNDANAAVNPAAPEVCDLVDDDCDGTGTAFGSGRSDDPDAHAWCATRAGAVSGSLCEWDWGRSRPVCTFVCGTSRGDCNREAADGCENTLDNDQHCGGCGRSCLACGSSCAPPGGAHCLSGCCRFSPASCCSGC